MKKYKLNQIPKIPRSHQIVWYVCRAILFAWGTVMLFAGYTTEFLEGMFAIMLTLLWDLFQLFGGKCIITQISYKFQTTVAIMVCLYVAVGSTVNKFTSFEHIDVPEHFLSGMVAAEGGYIIAKLIQLKHRNDNSTISSINYVFGFCFAVALLTCWEFYEFTMDRLYGLNLQRSAYNTDEGLIDTMVDLILGTAGALIRLLSMRFAVSEFFKKKMTKIIKRNVENEQ